MALLSVNYVGLDGNLNLNEICSTGAANSGSNHYIFHLLNGILGWILMHILFMQVVYILHRNSSVDPLRMRANRLCRYRGCISTGSTVSGILLPLALSHNLLLIMLSLLLLFLFQRFRCGCRINVLHWRS